MKDKISQIYEGGKLVQLYLKNIKCKSQIREIGEFPPDVFDKFVQNPQLPNSEGKWTFDISIARTQANIVSVSQPMATYDQQKFLPISGGYMILSNQYSLFEFDLRHIQSYEINKKGLTISIFQVPDFRLLEFHTCIIGKITLEMKEKEFKPIIEFLDAMGINSPSTHRCLHCHTILSSNTATQTMEQDVLDSLPSSAEFCQYCYILWRNVIMIIKNQLPFSAANKQSLQLGVVFVKLFEKIFKNKGIVDSYFQAEFNYLKAQLDLVFFSMQLQNADNIVLNDEQRSVFQNNLQSLQDAYNIVKSKGYANAISSYGYTLAKYAIFLDQTELAITLLEEGAEYDLKINDFGNYIKGINQILPLYQKIGKHSQVITQFSSLRQQSGYSNLDFAQYVIMIFHTGFKSAIELQNLEEFQKIIDAFIAYLKSGDSWDERNEITSLYFWGKWYKKAGQLDQAKASWEKAVFLGIRLHRDSLDMHKEMVQELKQMQN